MTDEELISAIEAIRAQNNIHWMDLVRLAIRLDPVHAKQILRRIEQADGEVRTLTQALSR